MAAAARPCHEIGPAAIPDHLTIEIVDLRGSDAAALFADDLEWIPVAWPVRVADFLVDAADDIRVAEDRANGVVEAAAPVDVAHAVARRADAELGEDVEELAHVVFGQIRRARARRRGNVAQRLAEVR